MEATAHSFQLIKSCHDQHNGMTPTRIILLFIMALLSSFSTGMHIVLCHWHDNYRFSDNIQQRRAKGKMDLLTARLARLGCPAFLRPPSSDALSALELRRPLLLWLHAVYSDPSVRLAEDEKWARGNPSDADLERWLRSLVGGCSSRECTGLASVPKILTLSDLYPGSCRRR